MLYFDTPSKTAAKKTKTTQICLDDHLAGLIERAAVALAVDKSVFLRSVIEREATRVLERRSRHVLMPEDAAIFAAALDAHPSPTAGACKAARDYRTHVVYAD